MKMSAPHVSKTTIVVLDVDVYLRFEPKSWAGPMTTAVLSDSFVTSFMHNKPMSWGIRGAFAVQQGPGDHYYAVLRCTETGTVRFTLSPLSTSSFMVLDHRGVMHSFEFGTHYLTHDAIKDVPCVQGTNLYINGSYSQGSVSWEPTSSEPAPTPAPQPSSKKPLTESSSYVVLFTVRHLHFQLFFSKTRHQIFLIICDTRPLDKI